MALGSPALRIFANVSEAFCTRADMVDWIEELSCANRSFCFFWGGGKNPEKSATHDMPRQDDDALSQMVGVENFCLR
jgi:hypothetical protein